MIDAKKMIEALLTKKKTVAVVGLGYVGLPVALAFAKKYKVIGYDVNSEKVASLQAGVDPNLELELSDYAQCDIVFTDNSKEIESASVYIVAVPTPVDVNKVPDLTYLKSASEQVGKLLSKGDVVIYESTVYPGCTEEECIPIVEESSSLAACETFYYGYSPERVNPGDKKRPIESIRKVVSGCSELSLEFISNFYQSILDAEVFKAKSVKVAEAAKVVENTQRDLNISLVNELSVIFDRMDIDTLDVIEAASSKWNFMPFYPGLVGGHCIAVDPYYLTYKSKQLGYDPQVILSGRRVNNRMPAFVAKKLLQLLLKKELTPAKSKVLVLGATFKENVSDVRNSMVLKLVSELQDFSIDVEIYDPMIVKEKSDCNVLIDEIKSGYDAVVFAVKHDCFEGVNLDYLKRVSKDELILIDIKGVFRGQLDEEITYWAL